MLASLTVALGIALGPVVAAVPLVTGILALENVKAKHPGLETSAMNRWQAHYSRMWLNVRDED